ncbi:MAG: hypothetical protein AVDCRST_MAG30-4024, partial [uncultured Solirubrobacteraceae bacterium]
MGPEMELVLVVALVLGLVLLIAPRLVRGRKPASAAAPARWSGAAAVAPAPASSAPVAGPAPTE